MKQEEEVLAKFGTLRQKRLSQRIQRFSCKSPINCVYNRQLRLKGNGKCGTCDCEDRKSIEGRIFVCNEDETAISCPYFECKNTADAIGQDFEDVLCSPARCGNEYPKLAIMIWFLQDWSRRNRSDRIKTAVYELYRAFVDLLLWRWW